jgi:hypothetical protein
MNKQQIFSELDNIYNNVNLKNIFNDVLYTLILKSNIVAPERLSLEKESISSGYGFVIAFYAGEYRMNDFLVVSNDLIGFEIHDADVIVAQAIIDTKKTTRVERIDNMLSNLNRVAYNEEIIKVAMDNYEKDKDNNTIQTSQIAWVKVGNVGIYELFVRYANRFNQKPSWCYSLRCGGATSDIGYDSLQSAITAALEVANQKEAEFADKYGF